MSALPSSWDMTYLETVADVIRGVSYRKADATNQAAPGLIPIVRATNIGERLMADDGLVFIPDHYVRHEQRLRSGDIIVVTSSGSSAVVGKSAILDRSWDGAFGAFCCVIRAKDGVHPHYLSYYLQDRSVRNRWSAAARGTNINNLKVSDIQSTPIPLAPFAEQRRIVAATEEQFSRIDAGASSLQRARRNLQRMRAAVLQAAVTGGLVPQNPDDEPAAGFLTEVNREAGPYPLPAGWLWARVEDLAEVQGGIQKQPKRRPGKNAHPFLRVANVLRSELDLREVHMIELFDGELDRYRLRPGDLLVVEGNGSPDQIGRSALWQGEIDPCVHQNHLIRARPGPALSPHYLNVFWNAPSTTAAVRAVASSTSGLYTLSTAKVRRVLVAVPPVSEQERISLEVSRQLSLIDAAQRVIDEVSGRARSLKAATLGHAFAGRLVPQDTSDEPAEVLLDRIKAARAVYGSAAARPRQRSRR